MPSMSKLCNGVSLCHLTLLVPFINFLMPLSNNFIIKLVLKFFWLIWCIVNKVLRRKWLILLVYLNICMFRFLILCLIMIFNSSLFIIYRKILEIRFSLLSITSFYIYVSCFTIISYKWVNSRALLRWLLF